MTYGSMEAMRADRGTLILVRAGEIGMPLAGRTFGLNKMEIKRSLQSPSKRREETFQRRRNGL